MLRADGSLARGLVSGTGVSVEDPALDAQLFGDRRVTPERAHALQVTFDESLTDVPVWNQRQHVGTLTAVAIELAGDALIPFTEDPAE